MEINRKELIEALKRAMPGVESGNVILEGADTFVFDGHFVHTYNDNISVSVPLVLSSKGGAPMTGALKAKDFYELINRYVGDVLKIIPKDGIWVLKSENSIAELTLLKNDMVERIGNIIPDGIKWHPLPERFIDGMSLCRFTANKSVLSGIHVDNTIITSTDEIRINWYELDSAINGSFWISDSAVAELIRLDNPKKYAISDSWVHFKTENGTIFSCKRLAQDKYPMEKIKVLIGAHTRAKTDVGNELPIALMDAVNRAAALSQNIESFDTIRLTFTTENIEVFSQRPSGRYTEVVPWDKPFKKPIKSMSIFVDYSMIENGIKYSKTFYLKPTMVKDKEVVRIVLKHEFGLQLISTFDGASE